MCLVISFSMILYVCLPWVVISGWKNILCLSISRYLLIFSNLFFHLDLFPSFVSTKLLPPQIVLIISNPTLSNETVLISQFSSILIQKERYSRSFRKVIRLKPKFMTWYRWFMGIRQSKELLNHQKNKSDKGSTYLRIFRKPFSLMKNH